MNKIKILSGREFDIKELIEYMTKNNYKYIIQGQNLCNFVDHSKPHSLDYWIRDNFALHKDSKQASNEVIEQILKTGKFKLGKYQCKDSNKLCKGLELLDNVDTYTKDIKNEKLLDKTYNVNDLDKVVLDLFHKQNTPDHRYASFDYCFNYFQSSTADQIKIDKEKACLQLGFYLASWGMLRGSSFLLQKSVKYYEPLITYIIRLKEENHLIWYIDIDNYTDSNIEIILTIYNDIKNLIIEKNTNNRDLVLVTKIMLGVFGCIPAYDQYFTQSFRNIFKKSGFRSVSRESLICLREFYESNNDIVDNLHNEITTIDFLYGNETKVKYTKAKIIDMYGFAKSFDIN